MPQVEIVAQEHAEAPPVCLEIDALQAIERATSPTSAPTLYLCLAGQAGEDLLWISAIPPGGEAPACPPATGKHLRFSSEDCTDARALAAQAINDLQHDILDAPARPQRPSTVDLRVGGGAWPNQPLDRSLGAELGVALPWARRAAPLAIELRAGAGGVFYQAEGPIAEAWEPRGNLALLANLRPQPLMGDGRWELSAGPGIRAYLGKSAEGARLNGATLSDMLSASLRMGADLWDLPQSVRLGLNLRLELPPIRLGETSADPPLTLWITAKRSVNRAPD